MLRRPALRRSLPATLLLGLLALLLWGQCAFNLNDSSPLPPGLEWHVARTDSLRAATPTRPATLYLTLDVYNNTPRELYLRELRGTLDYRNQSWAWQASYPLPRPLPLPGATHRSLALAIALVPADSVAALRASLRTTRYLPSLSMHGTYSRQADGRGRRFLFQALDYLPLL